MKYSKKWMLIASAILACALICTACGGGNSEPAQGPSVPALLNLGTHPAGSLVNSLGTGLGSVLSKHMQTQVRVMPTTGPVEWLPMLTSGEIDLGVLNNWDAQMGRAGKAEYAAATGGKGAPMYLLCSGTPSKTGVLVADNSSIKTGQDLKGKRYVGVFTGSGGLTAQADAFLANYGLTRDDVKIISVPGITDGVRAIIEGRADATGSAALGLSTTKELDAEKGARYLSSDPSPEAVARMQEKYPCTLVEVEPGPGSTGVKEPTWLMSYDFYLVSSEQLSEEAAYAIVKTLWENYGELGDVHVQLKEWTKDRFVTETATIPYHPGAVKFYKEVGAWTPAMDTLQNSLLAK